MNVLFWNLRKRDLGTFVATLAAEHEIDLIILAEPDNINNSDLVNGLSSQSGSTYRYHAFPGQERLRFFSRYPQSHFSLLEDSGGISARKVQPPGCHPLIMVAVHSPSQMHWHTIGDRLVLATRIREVLESVEKRQGHKRSFVVGDFNSDPFDEGLINSDGLHAVPTRKIAARKSRKVDGQNRQFLYNPMWSLFGDLTSGPPGSYYYPKSVSSCRFWHLFDQVLLRPELVKAFDSSKLEIITSIGSTKLISKIGIPKKEMFSDHLPILFSIKVMEYFLND
jgi:hypothetical protein